MQNNFLQIDEVRYLEDKEPIGFNYVKLGLQDVLLEPKTGIIYTPNTNQTTQMLTKSVSSGIIQSEEIRKKTNWIKGEHGYFAGSVSDGAGGSARITKKEYFRLCSEIVTDHPEYEDGSSHYCYNRDHFYGFTVIEPGSYDFNLKVKIEGNEDLLERIRRGKNDRERRVFDFFA